MFSNPVKNVKTFGLQETDIVVDLGAGTGHYATVMSFFVPRGKVYAVEIQKDFLNKIHSKAKDLNILNLECLLGDIEKKGGTKIKDKAVDAVLASNVLFQARDKDAFLDEAKRILKPKGKFILIDWHHQSSILSKNHKAIPKSKAREMLEEKGLIWYRDIDVGEHHYGIILKNQ